MLLKLKYKLGLSEAPSNEELLIQFKTLYENHQLFIRNSIFHMLRSSDGLDDLMQETFLKAWKSFGNFRQDSSVKTWLYRIAMNTTYDYFRKHQNQREQAYELDDLASSVDHQYNLELSQLIDQGMQKLSFKHQEVFNLFYKAEYDIKEIAELLEVSEGTVKSRLHYAKNTFAQFLAKNGVVL